MRTAVAVMQPSLTGNEGCIFGGSGMRALLHELVRRSSETFRARKPATTFGVVDIQQTPHIVVKRQLQQFEAV